MSTIRAMLQWTWRYPWVLIITAAAYLLGVVTMLNLGFKVPDAALNLIGACIAAVAGIGGALSVVLANNYLEGKNIAEYVAWSYLPVAFKMGVSVGHMSVDNDDASGKWTDLSWKQLIDGLEDLRNAIETAAQRMRRVEPNIHKLRARTLHMTNLLDEERVHVQDIARQIEDESKRHVIYGGVLNPQLRKRFEDAAQLVIENVTTVQRQYRIQTG